MDINIVSRADVTMGIDELIMIKDSIDCYIKHGALSDRDDLRAKTLFNEITKKINR